MRPTPTAPPRYASGLYKEPVAADFDVSGGVDEKVFGLEVAMHDVQRLQILEGQDHLARIQLRLNLAIQHTHNSWPVRPSATAAAWSVCISRSTVMIRVESGHL